MTRDDGFSAEALFPIVYDELRGLAERRLQSERADHTLQPTALVHEAWIRLRADRDQRFEDRTRFLRAAASAMRRILIDHARRKLADKRGGGVREETLDGVAPAD
ncbi:MAG: ECF-type sigma factor, partial [Planctomycetota bacterium JB042]